MQHGARDQFSQFGKPAIRCGVGINCQICDSWQTCSLMWPILRRAGPSSLPSLAFACKGWRDARRRRPRIPPPAPRTACSNRRCSPASASARLPVSLKSSAATMAREIVNRRPRPQAMRHACGPVPSAVRPHKPKAVPQIFGGLRRGKPPNRKPRTSMSFKLPVHAAGGFQRL
jgi:hypothetical protein